MSAVRDANFSHIRTHTQAKAQKGFAMCESVWVSLARICNFDGGKRMWIAVAALEFAEFIVEWKW